MFEKLSAILFLFFSSTSWSAPYSVVIPKQEDEAKINAAFFENSKRRDLNDSEKAVLVEIETRAGTCGGFFTENRNRDFLITTARHCAVYYFPEMCQQGKISVTTESGRFKGVCSEVVAEDPKTDIVTFRARFEANQVDQVRAHIAFLRLKATDPRIGTPLKALGYPADPYRLGKSTVTENCWVNGPLRSRSEYYNDLLLGYYTQSEIAEVDNANRGWPKGNEGTNAYPDVELRANRVYKSALLLGHNCTIYYGNSGGPMMIDKTNEVVGLGSSAVTGIFREIPSSASNSMGRISEFVVNNRSNLQAAGVILAP